jgi:hypothetical protein
MFKNENHGAVIAPRFEIQTWVGNEWENLWHYEDDNGERIPMTFASEAEARHELAEYFREQVAAYEAGLIHDLSDFENHRIEEIVE